MITKIYDYVYDGVAGSVDVTVSIDPCDNISVSTSFSNIYVSLSEALPFPLNIRFAVTQNRLDNSGNQIFNYFEVMPIGANQTSDVLSYICRTEQSSPLLINEYTYEFADQDSPQIVGELLAASIASQSNVSCFGGSNGQILLNVSGGVAPYTFIWSDGANTQNRNNLIAGTYSVTVKDVNNTEVIISNIVISQPSQIVPNPSVTSPTCFGGSNGTISLSPSGGTPPYTFLWSDNSNLQNRTNLPAGTYSVTIKDDSNCQRVFIIPVTQPLAISIQTSIDGGNVTNTVSGGTAPYSFLWSDGITTKDRTDLNEGVYSFQVTDANGCTQITTIVIQDFKFFFSKNPINLSLQANDIESKANLSFVCSVNVEDVYKSNVFDLKYSSEQPARVDGSTDFNVQQVLNAFLDAYVPEFGDSQIVRVNEGFKRFFLSYFEKFGNPPVPNETSTNETFYVLYGGLSNQEFAKKTFFNSYLETKKPFLSWSPEVQVIAYDQHAFLHFVVVNPLINQLTLKAFVTYVDGTGGDMEVVTVGDVNPFEVYRFPAGIGQLGIEVLKPDNTIKRYSLQLFSNGVPASELRTYEVMPAKKHFKKLLYLNSVGGWDHVLCLGRGKNTLRTQEERISRNLPVNFGFSDREEETVNKSGVLTGELVIATLNGYQRQHLIDLAISEKVFEQTATGYLPVSVKFDFDPSDDFENLDEIGLDIIYPTIRRYTPEL